MSQVALAPKSLGDHALRIFRKARAVAAGAMTIVVALAGCDNGHTPEETALLECRKAVLSATKYPSKADFHWSLGRATAAEGGGYLVAGDVKLMNAFGAMIPHRYVCDYEGGRAEVVAVRPG